MNTGPTFLLLVFGILCSCVTATTEAVTVAIADQTTAPAGGGGETMGPTQGAGVVTMGPTQGAGGVTMGPTQGAGGVTMGPTQDVGGVTMVPTQGGGNEGGGNVTLDMQSTVSSNSTSENSSTDMKSSHFMTLLMVIPALGKFIFSTF